MSYNDIHTEWIVFRTLKKSPVCFQVLKNVMLMFMIIQGYANKR